MIYNLAILIATHNNYEFLAQTISGIYEYTSTPFELIVIDNCSTQNETVCYLNEIEKREDTKILRLPKNYYYFPAINKGIQSLDRSYRFILILNDDVVIKGPQWLQYMIDVLESEDRIGYVGDFLPKRFCPPFQGWIDGWCMLFKFEVFDCVGLFDPRYIWWYAPADYAIRAYKAGYIIKDIKRSEDQHNHIKGVIRHLVGKTYEKVKDDPNLPVDMMFVPDFRYSDLLKKHGLYWFFLQIEIVGILSLTWRKTKSLIRKIL